MRRIAALVLTACLVAGGLVVDDPGAPGGGP
jgi:hypothetical protein